MKLPDSFKRFLRDTVNLNTTRYDRASDAVGVISNYLKSDDTFKSLVVKAVPQGSFKQQTIIKPIGGADFDVDVRVELKEVEGWEPKDYLNKIAAAFRKSDRYKDLVDRRGKSRCVTIDYETDFHIDVVPSVQFAAQHHVVNKNSNQWELSDGDGYAEWFQGRNSLTNGGLRRAVKLLKYVRDAQGAFKAKSILLTTLLGMQVHDQDDAEELYLDTPTALLTLVTRLDSYLQANVYMPTVYNPANGQESFNRHWTQELYTKFRSDINALAAKVSAAYDCEDMADSVALWEKVFGEKFPAPGNVSLTKGAGAVAVRPTPSTRAAEPDVAPEEEFLDELGIPFQDHGFKFKIDAIVKENGFLDKLLSQLRRVLLPRERSLLFHITSSNVPEPVSIYWKVRNYGEQAARLGQLRGKIIADEGHRQRKETTRYHGTHYVECYAIRDGVCVAVARAEVPIS